MSQPKIESWMPEGEIAFRKQFPALVEQINYSSTLPFEIGPDYQIFNTGQQSVVALINPGKDTQAVIKTSLNQPSITQEATILEHWSQVVATPKLIHLHRPNVVIPTAFFVAEFISSPRLKEIPVTDRLAQGYSRQMGISLAAIHKLSTPQDLETPPQVTTENVATTATETTSRLIDLGLLNQDDSALIANALKVIQTHNDLAVLGHGDFLAYNLFLRNRSLVVFDPQATVASPMRDLANTMVNTVAEVLDYGISEAQEILAGYGSQLPITGELLRAYFQTQCVTKIERWHRKHLEQKVARTIGYLRNIPI